MLRRHGDRRIDVADVQHAAVSLATLARIGLERTEGFSLRINGKHREIFEIKQTPSVHELPQVPWLDVAVCNTVFARMN